MIPTPLRLLTALLLAAALAAPGTVAQTTLPASVVKNIDAVFAKWDSTSSPGCALGISRNGDIIYTRGYGMSNFEYDVAITPASIFHVASISKQFTAMAIELLARDGKLSLDDDVRKYITELPDYGHRITIRHLLHHTSGLRDQWSLLGLAGWRDDDLITEDDVLRIVSRQRGVNFDPGDEYLYSNTGFTLAAVIVKRVSGLSLHDFSASRIFQPLGMTSTHFHDDHTMIVRGRTSAYQPRKTGGWLISIPVFDTYGATSLFTTVGDLLKWEQNFDDPRVGDRRLLDEMQTSGRLTDGDLAGYGLGLTLAEYGGVRTVGHGGADAGYRADVVRFPEHHLAVTALCNLSNINPAALTREVAKAVLGPSVIASLPSAVAVSDAELNAVAGTYWNPITDQVRRMVVKDHVLISSGTSLEPLGGGRFRAAGQPTGAQFDLSAGSPAPLLLVDRPPMKPAVFERLAPAPAGLSSDVDGDYRSDELGLTYSIARSAGRVVIKAPPRLEDVTVERIAADTFTNDAGWTVTFTRKSGAVDGLMISTGRVRRLRFVKLGASRGPNSDAARIGR